MNLRKAPASSMQKTYDECYLICSTAIYFEGQNNEVEALRAWRNALDQIYYHNAYKMPTSYTPRSETEKALQDSLRSMELQCKERVDLLEALKKSRDEAAEEAKNGESQDGVTSIRNSTSSLTKSPAAQSKKTWLGNDTIPQASYDDLPRLVNGRPVQVRPAARSRASYGPKRVAEQDAARTRSLPYATSAASFNGPSLAPPAEKESPRPSRTPSPEKKGGMLRTLRSNSGKDRAASNKMQSSLRTKAQPAAAKAATQVWAGGHRASNGSIDAQANTGSSSSAQWDPYTRSLVTTPASDARASDQPTPEQPSQTTQPKPPRRSRESESISAGTSYVQAYRAGRTSLQPQKHAEAMAPPPVPPHRTANHNMPTTQPTANNNISEPTSPDDKKSSTVSLSQLGQVQPISYMKEYPNHPPAKPRKPPEIAMKQAASLAVGSRPSGASTAKTTQSRTSPIPRKAVGASRAAGLVNAIAQRQQLDDAQNRSIAPPSSAMTAELPPVGLPMQNKLVDSVVAEDTPPSSRDEFHESTDDIDKQAWDAKVSSLMRNLPKGVDEAAAKQILNEIVIQGDEVHWDDVAGLEVAKSALKETVVYPFLRPDLFMGLREPARGMLLFGPPGTGKTMLARAVATESRSVFFAISASSLTSKYLGDSEKLVRALFALAKAMAPSIIFVDEIDSLLSARGGSSEHEATRRIKTEFLIQWSDLQKAAAGRIDEKNKETGDPTRVLVLAATNLPWAIDEAARRRFVRRQYIPLPEDWVRKEQLQTLLAAQKHSMKEKELVELVKLTDGFSGSDITALAKDAAMGPLRSLGEKLLHMSPEDIRPIGMQDFQSSLKNIRPSVSRQGLKEFEDWAKEFGERGG